jgi:hypothetical protein
MDIVFLTLSCRAQAPSLRTALHWFSPSQLIRQRARRCYQNTSGLVSSDLGNITIEHGDPGVDQFGEKSIFLLLYRILEGQRVPARNASTKLDIIPRFLRLDGYTVKS